MLPIGPRVRMQPHQQSQSFTSVSAIARDLSLRDWTEEVKVYRILKMEDGFSVLMIVVR